MTNVGGTLLGDKRALKVVWSDRRLAWRCSRRAPVAPPWKLSPTAVWRRALLAILQRFDQEEDFGSHRVVQVGGVGERAVAAAGYDGLEGLDKGAEPHGQIGIGGILLDEGASQPPNRR